VKIIFQDVDGPLIPGRLYYHRDAHYSKEHATFKYDPVAVGMLRELVRLSSKNEPTFIVYNTAHNVENRNEMRYKARVNGFEDLLHEDCRTDFCVDDRGDFTANARYAGIARWVEKYNLKETDWIVFDDEPNVHPRRQVKVDFDVGMTMKNFQQAGELLGIRQSKLVGF
jgi:hypothetical protein